jgi:hypothetical protein
MISKSNLNSKPTKFLAIKKIKKVKFNRHKIWFGENITAIDLLSFLLFYLIKKFKRYTVLYFIFKKIMTKI